MDILGKATRDLLRIEDVRKAIDTILRDGVASVAVEVQLVSGTKAKVTVSRLEG